MIPGVGPLLLAAAGVAAFGAAVAILRSFGPGYRVGRLLAVAPKVSVGEALAIAQSGTPRYVRVDGRVDSERDFEDQDHRPLVLRRTTTEWQATHGGSWRPFDARNEVVPFVIREGLDEITVEASNIDEGLVTVPREYTGVAAEVAGMTALGIDPAARVRMHIGYVSTVDHAAVLGVPARGAGGVITIGPGMGRPLVISTLEDDEAMRVLSGGAMRRSRVAIACLAVGAVLVGLAAAWWLLDAVLGGASAALAATPAPSLRPGSDTRTSGAGPGLVGDPVLAILGVVGIALLSLLGSLAYVRLTGGRRPTR